MLKLYTGTNLHTIANALLDEFREEPLGNPLSPELFIVQNYGVARWLSLQIAEKEGIAANLQFKFPAEVYWNILRVMDPEIPENLPSERQPMTWAIFDILQSDIKKLLPVLYEYIHGDDSLKQEMRCWNLACRIADVFDQYLTYRPEMLLGWEQDKVEYQTSDPTEQWQAVLWRKLMYHWHGKGKRQWNHRAELGKKLIKELDKQAFPANKLTSRISIFGVTEMPEVYLNTFLKLSKTIDVHVYLITAPEDTGNALVNSLGQTARDFTTLIQEQLQKDTKVNSKWIDAKGEERPDNDKLFNILKRDLISEKRNTDSVKIDESIQVHSCHSPRREVEVLYDQLLNLFNDDKTLDPSDVLVLSPQMDEYAPIIDAVFGAPEQQMPEIPYHLSNSLASTQIVNLSFEKLLDLVDSRFKVTDVMDLLDYKPIRDAFSLTEDDISTLERWIGDNRIRWGINGEHKNELGLPGSNSFTWQAGLHRMMAGYAMDTQDDLLFDNIYPFDEIQKADHARLLGRFSNLLNHLFECHQKTKKSLSPAGWGDVFIHWLSLFYTEDESFYRQVQWLREQFAMLSDQTSRAHFNGTISFPIIKNYITEVIEQRSTGGGRAGAGITFSSLVQMHSIPAKVICMIGMDDGVFPASKIGVQFDLITKYPHKGDRVQRRNDRQIFLETMLAAGQSIYFSYTGQSNRKEVEFPPSVVLRELIDYITDKYKIDIDEVTQKHRLHAFSPQYFGTDKDRKLFSFSSTSRKVAQQLLKPESKEKQFIGQSLPEPDDAFRQLTVGNFISFFQYPARFLLQQRLGIYLRQETVLDEDREAFDLNALARYSIGQELLDRYLSDKNLESYRPLIFAQDRLPENWPGEQAFAKEAEEVTQFGRHIKQRFNQKKLEATELDIQIDDFHIFGRLDQIYEEEQLLYRFGKMRPKDVIELWIKHLLFQLGKPDSHSGISSLYTRGKKKPMAFYQLSPVTNAHEILHDLLRLYWAGLQGNTMFFPNISFAYTHEVIFKDGEEGDGIKNAQKEWVDSYRNYPKEGDDPYNKRLMGRTNPLEDKNIYPTFKKISKSVWGPFFKVLNKDGEGVG